MPALERVKKYSITPYNNVESRRYVFSSAADTAAIGYGSLQPALSVLSAIRVAPSSPGESPAPLEALADTVRWLTELFPLRRVKFTGGEPLLRRGLTGLIESVAALPNLEDLSLTTNGSLLSEAAHSLRKAGLQRVNISLDSVHPLRFQDMTGGRLEDPLAGIRKNNSECTDPARGLRDLPFYVNRQPARQRKGGGRKLEDRTAGAAACAEVDSRGKAALRKGSSVKLMG